MSMSVILLVKLEGSDCLYRANTQEVDEEWNYVATFKVWKDQNGIDLYWRGRRVEQVYSMSTSAEVWWQIPIPDAAESLLKRGDSCVEVSSEPSPEGRLPV